MLDIRVVREYNKRWPEVLNAINRKFLPEAGQVVRDEAFDRTPKKTGTLKSSLRYRVTRDQAIIGTNVEYAPYVEYGTRRQKEQSFLRTGLDAKRKELVSRWRSLFRKTFRALGVL